MTREKFLKTVGLPLIILIWVCIFVWTFNTKEPSTEWGPEVKVKIGECTAFTQGSMGEGGIFLRVQDTKSGITWIKNGETVYFCGEAVRIWADIVDNKVILFSPDVEILPVTRDLNKKEIGMNVTESAR
jgi:hypothetical protein